MLSLIPFLIPNGASWLEVFAQKYQLCIFFSSKWDFYTAQNVRFWYGLVSEEAQLKDELFSHKGRCDWVSCLWLFPLMVSRVFCITSVACLIKLFCSSTFSPSVFSSMFCRLCSLLKPPSVPGWERSQNSFWSHLKTSSNKPDWALWWY